MSVWHLAWKHVQGTGPLIVAASAVLLLTVVLFATGPLYLATLERLAFQQSLDRMGTGLHPQVLVSYSSFVPEDYRAIRQAVDAAARTTLKDALTDHGLYASTRFMGVAPDGVPGRDAIAFFQHRTRLADHVDVVAGRMPQPASGDGPIEVALGAHAADTLGLALGHRLQVRPGLPPPAPVFDVVLVGIVAPRDLMEEYWLSQGEDDFQTYTVGDRWVLPLFVTERDLLERVGARAPALLGDATDFLYLDERVVLGLGARAAANAIHDLEGRLAASVPRATLFAGLDGEAALFRQDVSQTRAPLVIVLLVTGAAVLYAAAMVSSVLADRDEGAVALLRSRGANIAGVGFLLLSWALLTGVAALLLAPLASWALVVLLGMTPGWRAVLEDGARLTPAPAWRTLPWAAAGALGVMAVFLVPHLRAARIPLPLLRGRRGRSGGAPWFQRFFLDAVVLVVAAALVWQLQQRQGVLSGTGQDAAIDRAALLVPVLALLVAVLAFARALPLLVRFLAFVARRTGLVGAGLAFERTARAPGPAMALGGISVLVVSLGAFVAAFGGTLERNAEDVASFIAGADARVARSGGYEGLGFPEMRRSFERVDGVENASAVYLSVAGTGGNQIGTMVPLIGVEPLTVGDVLWFREDFADRPLESLLADLALADDASVRPRVIPDGAVSLGVWVRTDTPKNNRFVWLNLTDALGRPHTYSLGALDATSWRLMETPLARGSQPLPPGPYAVRSILVYETAQGASGAPGVAFFDDLHARLSDGQTLTIDDLDRSPDWLPVVTTGARVDLVEDAHTSDPRHANVLRFEWGRETLDGVRGVYLSPGSRAVPILGGRGLGMDVGQRRSLHVAGRIVPVRVVGLLDQFPMVESSPAGFVVAHGPLLLAHVNAVNVGRPVWPNQALLELTDDPLARTAALATVQADPGLSGSLTDSQVLLEARRRSPLASAGWRGLVVVALAAGAASLVLGAIAHAASVKRDRALEMAVLRSLGFSRPRALIAYVVEYLSVGGLAVSIGVAAGLWLSGVLVPLFQGAGPAAPQVPSLVLRLDWPTVIGAVALPAIAAVTVALFLWRSFGGLWVAGVLRSDGE